MTEHPPPDDPASQDAPPDQNAADEQGSDELVVESAAPPAPPQEPPPPDGSPADSVPPWSEPPLDDAVEDEEDTQELEVPEPPLTRPDAHVPEAPEQVATAPVKSVWPAWAWMMVAVAVLVLGVGVIGGVLVPSLVLDIVSFWPGFLLSFLLAAAVWPLSKRFSHRLKATVPLLVLTWLGLGVALHLAGWEELPSSAGDLLGGPATEVESGSLTIEMDGALFVAGAAQPQLYAVEMLRRGGPVGAPQALETTPNGSISLDIVELPGTSWYSAAGWDVLLAESVTWTIEASAVELSIDIGSLTVDSAIFEGSGSVVLGAVASGGTVTLVGDLDVAVPSDRAVALLGTATVPAGWTETDSGWASPVDGDPYTLVVAEGSMVSIALR